ncbi:MAG: 4,5-DOPA dioxygenase extradiol [Sphaerochaeta sp.]
MTTMPVLFVGHGSPMNAIEDNDYTRSWKKIATHIPKPEAILSISAHWFTRGTRIMNEAFPKTVYDMYGFPPELYQVVYNAPGSPYYAEVVKSLISTKTTYDSSWGIDHGTWSVLVHMFPNKEIPLFQLSIDATAPPIVHYTIGQEIQALREQGVLIMGSGNIVHNLRLVDWHNPTKGFDWAYEFDQFVYENVVNKTHRPIINYEEQGKIASLAVPTPDHYYPLLYVLGSSRNEDSITVYNRSCVMGSLTMTSYLFSAE